MPALGFKVRVDSSLVCFLACVILRFTVGVTPADCVQFSMAAKSFWSTYLQIMYPQEMEGFTPTIVHAAAQRCKTFGHSSSAFEWPFCCYFLRNKVFLLCFLLLHNRWHKMCIFSAIFTGDKGKVLQSQDQNNVTKDVSTGPGRFESDNSKKGKTRPPEQHNVIHTLYDIARHLILHTSVTGWVSLFVRVRSWRCTVCIFGFQLPE